MNKDQNTKLRNQYIRACTKKIPLSTILELERAYGSYCYVPLNIPVFYDENLVQWFFDKCKPVTKQKADIAGRSHPELSVFNSVNVYFDEEYKKIPTTWSVNEVSNFKQDFPHFYQQLHDLLPVSYLPKINFWQSVRPVDDHRDQSNCMDFPNSFRIMLYDQNPKSTLYVYEDADAYVGDKFYVPVVSETNCFAWNNLRVVHGSDYDSKFKKILIIINDYTLDTKKYQQIMDRSISKYAADSNNYVLRSQNHISNFCTP